MLRAELEAELGAEPPVAVTELLDPEALVSLTSAVHEAKARQRAALDRAANDVLSHLPGLLRKTVLRILR